MIYAINKQTKEHRMAYGNEAHGVLSAFGHAHSDIEGYKFVEADADGWISHAGKECPLPGLQPVDIRMDDGRVHRGCDPEDWEWDYMGLDCSNIIAYRPVLDAKPKEPAWPQIGDRVSFVWAGVNKAGEVIAFRHGKAVVEIDHMVNLIHPMAIDDLSEEITPQHRYIDQIMEDCGVARCVARTIFEAGYRKEDV